MGSEAFKDTGGPKKKRKEKDKKQKSERATSAFPSEAICPPPLAAQPGGRHVGQPDFRTEGTPRVGTSSRDGGKVGSS